MVNAMASVLMFFLIIRVLTVGVELLEGGPSKAVEEHGLEINIKAPSPETPSMTMALEAYLRQSNKDEA